MVKKSGFIAKGAFSTNIVFIIFFLFFPWKDIVSTAKCIARHAVHHACQEADKKVYKNIDPKSSEVYYLANQFRRAYANIVGDKPVKNDAGEMSMSKDSKQAWLEHYQRLLNVEFDWDPDHLSDELPVEGLLIPITIDIVKKAISQIKAGKAPSQSGIVVEMIWAAGDTGASMIRDLAAAIICDGKVPSDWEQSFIVHLYKGKGYALERGIYTVSSWQSRSWKSWRGLWTASSDSWCHSTIPSLASSQAGHNRRNLCSQAAAREITRDSTWLS